MSDEKARNLGNMHADATLDSLAQLRAALRSAASAAANDREGNEATLTGHQRADYLAATNEIRTALFRIDRLYRERVAGTEQVTMSDQAEKERRTIHAAEQVWATQRSAAEMIGELMTGYVTSKYHEYRWLRGCTIDPAFREARECAKAVAEGAVEQAMNALYRSELIPTRTSLPRVPKEPDDAGDPLPEEGS